MLDRWDIDFRATESNCSFGGKPGDTFRFSYRFAPASNAQVIRDGDRVNVTFLSDREVQLGTFTFRFTDFQFAYPVEAPGGHRGTATLIATFADDRTVKDATLVESYDGGACTIKARKSS